MMADWYQRLVDVEVDEADAAALGDQLLDHLVAREIVDPRPLDDPSMRGDHLPGPRCSEALVHPLNGEELRAFRSQPSHRVAVEVGHAVHAIAVETQILCPVCGTPYDDKVWSDALNEWALQSGLARATCQRCGVGTPAELMIFVPAWALGNLAVVFWNWGPLHDDFVADLRTVLSPRSVFQAANL